MWGFDLLKDILDVVMAPIALVILSTLIAQPQVSGSRKR